MCHGDCDGSRVNLLFSGCEADADGQSQDVELLYCPESLDHESQNNMNRNIICMNMISLNMLKYNISSTARSGT